MCTCFWRGLTFAQGPIKYRWFLNRSISPKDGTLIGNITLSQSEPRSNGNSGVLFIPQISRTGTSQSDVSYPGDPERPIYIYIYIYRMSDNPKDRACHHNVIIGSARGVMVIVIGNGHGDTRSNPGRDWLHFT